MRIIDLTGQRFERLIVLQRNGSSKRGEALWLCKCNCGDVISVTGYHLREGHTRSCGCLLREIMIRRNTTHGMRYISGYDSWKSMLDRCRNIHNKYYEYYGGRGIIVCKRWEKFENFHTDMGEKPKGMTLDRENNSKGYCKSNCRWVSRQIQQNNMRSNHKVTFKGRTQTIAEWSREVGLRYGVLWNRLNTFKWSVERALTEPVNK